MSSALLVPSGIVAPSLEQVLQVMYFCDAAYCGPGRIEKPVIGALLTFEGSARGIFRVVVSEGRAVQMASDFLALDDGEINPDQVESAVSEFANIACGALMNAWMPAANLHFAVPRKIPIDLLPEFPHCFSVLSGLPEIGVDVSLD